MLKPTMLFNLHIMDVSNVVSSPQFVLPTLTPQKYALPTRPSPNALQQKNFHSIPFIIIYESSKSLGNEALPLLMGA
jgi:hypothetical protein